MTDAREIIARALIDLEPITRKAAERYADHIQSKFTAAGFRILGPDEVDQVTVEKCAAVADNLSETWTNSRDAFQAVQEAAASDKAHETAAAIRAIGRKA